MKKQTTQFATVAKNGTIQKVGKSVIYQFKTNFNNKGIKWFDDTKLYRRTTNK